VSGTTAQFSLSRRMGVLLWGTLCLFTLLAYVPGLPGPLIFDDIPALKGNAVLQAVGGSFDSWRTAAYSSSAGPLSRPLTMLSFAANIGLSGELSPFAIKLTNVLIHCAIGGLILLLCLSVFKALAVITQQEASLREVQLSFAVAAIWLLHPLHVSTVLYSVQRMAQLSTLFVVLGLLVYTRYRLRWSQHGATAGEVLSVILWLLLIGAFAVLSKENGILMFWLLPVIEICLFRGVWARQASLLILRLAWVALLLPLLLIAAMFLFMPEIFLGGYAKRDFTLTERVLTQARLLWTYLAWLVWPNILDMGFQHDHYPLSRGLLEPITTLLAVAAWAFALSAAFLLRHKYPVALFAVLFYLIAHSMESSFLALEMVYEHRNYLPSIGIIMALVVVLHEGLRRLRASYRPWIAVSLLLLLSATLTARAYSWGDELRLARDNLARHPESARSNYFYADALIRKYARRDSEGLSEREANEHLVRGRHYLELMHQVKPNDFGALTMLYYLDSTFFPELDMHSVWLARILGAVDGHVFSSSDRNALAVLFGCIGNAECSAAEADVRLLFEKLGDHYDNEADLFSFEYNYLKKSGADTQQMRLLLEDAIERWPTRFEFYPELIQVYAQLDDVAAMYAAMAQWMRYDYSRRQLSIQKAMFID
jgi:protein O-mannosyl-transferase